MAKHFPETILSKTLRFFLDQKLIYEVLSHWQYFYIMSLLNWVSYIGVTDGTVHKMLVLIKEWRDTHQHFVEKDSERPPVDRVIVALTREHLWREVLSGTTERPCHFVFVNFSR